MKKLVKIILDHFQYQDTNEFVYFNKFSQSIQDENSKHLYVSFFMFPVVYILLIAISAHIQGSINSIATVLLFIPEQFLYHLYIFLHKKFNPQKDMGSLDAIIYYTIFALQLILVDTIAFNHTEAMWFTSLIVILPAIYVDRLSGYILTDSALCIFYCIAVFMLKDKRFIERDIFEGIITLPIAIFIAMMVSTIRNAQAMQNQFLREESSYDKLTGLLNKGAAKKEVEEYFSHRPLGENTVVISIDADNFKQINDKLGHSAGDVVLSNMGLILKKHFRVDDIVARNGGDEFLVVMKGVVPPFHIDQICRRIQKSISEISIEGGWTFTCSLGVVIDTHQKDFASIFSMADDALYECKIRGRDCFSEWYTYDKIIPPDRPLVILSASRMHPNVEEVDDLLRKEFSILYAENGNEVLNLASQYCAQLRVIVLDMSIEKIPPDQVLSYIKQRPNFSHIKVVAACPSPTQIAIAKEGSADVIIPVPNYPDKVLAAVKKCLGE